MWYGVFEEAPVWSHPKPNIRSVTAMKNSLRTHTSHKKRRSCMQACNSITAFAIM